MTSLVNSASHNNGSINHMGSGGMQMGNNINNNIQLNNQRSLSNPAGGMMGHNQLQQQLQQPPQQQQQQQQTRNDTLAQLDLSSDLNFDPAAVIDGGGEGQEGLNVI